MNNIISIDKYDDIPSEYKNTPISSLLEYHNLGRELDSYNSAELLIGTCIDNRVNLRMPPNFSFIIRAGGANLKNSEFPLSFAVSIGNVRHIAIIGHSNCGMVNLFSKKNRFIQGLIENAGWNRSDAESHILNYAPMFEIENEIDFVIKETKRLRIKYPKTTIAPMLFKVEDSRLYLIEE